MNFFFLLKLKTAFGSLKYILYQIRQTMALVPVEYKKTVIFFEFTYSFIFSIRALTIENVLRWLIIVTTVDRDQILIDGSWQTESLSQHFFFIKTRTLSYIGRARARCCIRFAIALY